MATSVTRGLPLPTDHGYKPGNIESTDNLHTAVALIMTVKCYFRVFADFSENQILFVRFCARQHIC